MTAVEEEPPAGLERAADVAKPAVQVTYPRLDPRREHDVRKPALQQVLRQPQEIGLDQSALHAQPLGVAPRRRQLDG